MRLVVCTAVRRSIPVVLNRKHALYNKLVYSSIMEVFGGHVEYAVSGGAPLDSSIAHFFNGVGLPLLEGYGMTETCAPSSVNPTAGYKIGTIGCLCKAWPWVSTKKGNCASRALPYEPDTTTILTLPGSRLSMAGCIPVILAPLMMKASSPSSGVRRISSSPPAARTSPHAKWKRRS